MLAEIKYRNSQFEFPSVVLVPPTVCKRSPLAPASRLRRRRRTSGWHRRRWLGCAAVWLSSSAPSRFFELVEDAALIWGSVEMAVQRLFTPLSYNGFASATLCWPASC